MRARRTLLVVATALALVAVLAGGVLASAAHRANVRPAYAADGLLTILVIGSDVGWPTRPGDELRGRADALHLVAVDTVAKRATIVDIPRDAFIGGDKVNAHLAHGGPEAVRGHLQAYTGIPIDHWVLTTFHGLERMTAELGGIHVVVEQQMSATGTDVVLQAGPQTLGPHEALGFARDRKSMPGGDFDRTRNQGRLLRAAHAQIVGRHTGLRDLTRLSAVFLRDTHTSIPRAEVLPLALLAVQIPPDAVHQVSLRGGFGRTAGGASIVHLDAGDAFDRIRAGQVGP
jgi:polyisoprenyl-teichoic acid--peptidoglycan teichoic acid transferase